MNHPETYEKFVVPEGVKKVTFIPDTKLANAATFEIQREDHTVGDPLVMQLHEDKAVAFAAYKIPHPLEYRLQIKVKTTGASAKPDAVYNNAIDTLTEEIRSIKQQFKDQVTEMCGDVDFDPHENFEQHTGLGEDETAYMDEDVDHLGFD